ncbi:hypothetical protein HDU90_003365 [Geranomyces variabilis]|nr:hypothetical protein HDU90_003365 [Geranomyces variabilis]
METPYHGNNSLPFLDRGFPYACGWAQSHVTRPRRVRGLAVRIPRTRQIAEQIIDPNWEELKFHYLQGLDPKLADLVQAYPPNTKSQSRLFSAALRFESAHSFHGSREKGKSTSRTAASAAESVYVKTSEKKNSKEPTFPQASPSTSITFHRHHHSARRGTCLVGIRTRTATSSSHCVDKGLLLAEYWSSAAVNEWTADGFADVWIRRNPFDTPDSLKRALLADLGHLTNGLPGAANKKAIDLMIKHLKAFGS